MTTARGHMTVRRAARNGSNGVGVSIRTAYVMYASSTSGTQRPSVWHQTMPTVAQGSYLWIWTHVEYTDGTQTDAYAVTRMGIDGRGIQSSTVTYSQQASPVDTENITNWGPFPAQLTDGYWLYTKTHIVYSDSASTDSYSVSQIGVGSYYAGVEEFYHEGDSPDTPPQGAPPAGTYPDPSRPVTTWSQSRPTLTAEYPYLWNFEISRDSRGNSYVTDAICIGNFAKGIESIVETYAISEEGAVPQGRDYPSDIDPGDWTDEAHAAAPTNSKPYQWNRTVVTYNDLSTDTHYHVSAVKGPDGRGAVYIDLDNENDSLMYDGNGTKIGDNAVSAIRLYDNGADVTAAYLAGGGVFQLETTSGVAAAITGGSTVTVSAIVINSGVVTVSCAYNGVTYYAKMTVKRLVGVDKYQLVCTPAAVAVNTTTGTKSANKVKVEVYRTAQNGTRTLLSSLTPYGLTLKVDGTQVTYQSSKYEITVDASLDQHVIDLNKGQALEDSEAVPICKSANGNDGDPGNGISSILFYFMLTASPDAPAAGDTHWKLKGSADCPMSGTDAQPYLWRKEVMTYTQTAGDTVISLVSVFGITRRPQLLLQTDFDSKDAMTYWDIKNGSVIPAAHDEMNAFGTIPQSGNDPYYNMLRQAVSAPGSFCRLQGGKYFCLSFLVRDRKVISLTTYKYHNEVLKIYLRAGRYKVEFNGHCSQAANQAGVALRVMLRNDTTSVHKEGLVTSTIDGTFETMGELAVLSPGWYYVEVQAYGGTGQDRTDHSETVTCNWIRVINVADSNRFATYLYGGAPCVDMDAPWYVDGKVTTPSSSDGFCLWRLASGTPYSDGWVRHSVAWKMVSAIPSDALKMILFRAYNCYVEVCMPKLEQSIIPTEWCRHEDDPAPQMSYNVCGKWTSGETYYYCSGQRDVVSAVSSAQGARTWFRMKKRTTEAGYVSTVEPYLDPEHWEQGNQLKFIVTDLMFAEDIITTRLTVSKIISANNNFIVNPDGSVEAAGGKFVIDVDGNIKAEDGEFSGAISADSLTQPFHDVPAVHTYSISDSSNVILGGTGAMANFGLTLPDGNAAFNGRRVLVSWDGMRSRFDSGHAIVGCIRVPQKDFMDSDFRYHEYIAARMESYTSGFAELICVNSHWVLINIQGDIDYTQYTS